MAEEALAADIKKLATLADIHLACSGNTPGYLERFLRWAENQADRDYLVNVDEQKLLAMLTIYMVVDAYVLGLNYPRRHKEDDELSMSLAHLIDLEAERRPDEYPYLSRGLDDMKDLVDLAEEFFRLKEDQQNEQG